MACSYLSEKRLVHSYLGGLRGPVDGSVSEVVHEDAVAVVGHHLSKAQGRRHEDGVTEHVQGASQILEQPQT